MVENQLNCYISAANSRQITLSKNGTLNGISFVHNISFVLPFAPVNALGNSPTDAKVWCVWAPETLPGHIYFSKLIEAPPAIQTLCHPNPGRGPDPVLDPQMVKDLLAKLAAVLAAILAGTAAAAGLRGRIRPAPQPAYSRLRVNAPQTYNFAVVQLPDRARQLNIDWGDGTSTAATVPSGSGALSFSFTKSFTNTTSSVRRLVQSATIGASSALAASASSPIVEEDPTFQFFTDIDPVTC